MTEDDTFDILRRKPLTDIDWHSDGLLISRRAQQGGLIYDVRPEDDPFWSTFYEETGWSRDALLRAVDTSILLTLPRSGPG